MTPDEIAKELHNSGDCDPSECNYCDHDEGYFHPVECKCNECKLEIDMEVVE